MELPVVRPLRNTHENESCPRSVTVISHQQQQIERVLTVSASDANQEYLEPVYGQQPPVHDDLPPNYETPPSYEECTTNPD